ncbi:MAG: glycine zipper domain-containing protein [Planctomycetota bacterium]
MTHRILIAALLISFVASEADAQSRKYRRRGVILGGLAGAAIGAAIGDKGDNETAGALIGAAAGAVAGGTIGNQKDQRLEQSRRYRQWQPVPYYPQQGVVIPGRQQSVPHYNQPHFYGTPSNVPTPALPPQSAVIPDDRGVIVQEGQSVLMQDDRAFPPTFATAPEKRGVSPEEVVSMVNVGLIDAIIIQQIEQIGVTRPLTVRDIIQLHQSGVSESVISAMQSNAPVSE